MNKVDSVKIRMYNTGSVGDCFLLLFYKQDQLSFTMLIDCGGYKTKKELIEKCVLDIKNTIVNNTIDLVVVTHEHEDHVSGFNQAKSVFDGITFKQVWMSWAENEEDPLAMQLLKEKGKKVKALTAILKKNMAVIKRKMRTDIRQNGLKRSLKMRHASFKAALDTLEFENVNALTSLGVRLKISDAMRYVKKKSQVKAKTKMYKLPGQVINDMPGAEGVKFHILGPPRDKNLQGIKNDMQHDEMYSLARRLGLHINNFHFNAFDATSDSEVTLISPFSEKYQMDAKEKKELNKYYIKGDGKWRQIEYDWIDSAGELAIALTDFVNNTSLAMAIQLGSGKVLLFPADAQSGNWISWHDKKVQQELVKNGGKTADVLLQRTVFYKVGHHGSHNGTASKSGLDKMKEENNIVAFMPLVQDKVPSQWGGDKNFPAKALYKKLIEKTRGAIIRNDEGLIKDKKAGELLQTHFNKTKITALKNASKSGLYHEWEIKD